MTASAKAITRQAVAEPKKMLDPALFVIQRIFRLTVQPASNALSFGTRYARWPCDPACEPPSSVGARRCGSGPSPFSLLV